MKLGQTCDNCGLKVKKEHRDHRGQYVDPCLGILPGVKYGCCGHGEEDGYLFFLNGVTVRFETTEVEHTTVSKYHRFNDETTTPKLTQWDD